MTQDLGMVCKYCGIFPIQFCWVPSLDVLDFIQKTFCDLQWLYMLNLQLTKQILKSGVLCYSRDKHPTFYVHNQTVFPLQFVLTLDDGLAATNRKDIHQFQLRNWCVL